MSGLDCEVRADLLNGSVNALASLPTPHSEIAGPGGRLLMIGSLLSYLLYVKLLIALDRAPFSASPSTIWLSSVSSATCRRACGDKPTILHSTKNLF